VNEEIEIEEGVEEKVAHVVVERCNGASGTVSCHYHTEDMGALAGMDYKEASGTIELGPAVQTYVIDVPILPKGRYETTAGFNVILDTPVGCRFDSDTDGGDDSCVCHVLIKGAQTQEKKTIIARMESQLVTRTVSLGHKHWREQFYAAVFSIQDDDDDDDDDADDKENSAGPSILDWCIHIVSLPWKLLFAFVPPPDFLNGWACFCGALVMIAVVTAIVGDMANLVGCVLGIEPEITAITFVALGTSLPDTFASKTAASMDPYADASIGNITGSNSVNVFLGLGLSWSLASFYWESQKPSDLWNERVMIPGGRYYDVQDDVKNVMRDGNAVFVVPTGSLGWNLLVFCTNAFFAIQHLWARRRRYGGELGGPKMGFMGQYFSAAFLIFQWIIYIAVSASIAVTTKKDKD
jgi:solute carrier family 8 (sodium/calcium exchanger)